MFRKLTSEPQSVVFDVSKNGGRGAVRQSENRVSRKRKYSDGEGLCKEKSLRLGRLACGEKK